MRNVFHVIFSLSQLYPIFAVKMAHLERYFNILFAISLYTSFSANSVQKRANFENEILKTIHNNLKKRGWLSSETWENPSDFSNADAFDYENGSAMLGKPWIGAI